jgi:hypothetical protein
MRRLIGAFLLVFVGAAALAQSPADDVGPEDRAAIRAVIESQIAAFRRDDAAAAYAQASPSIQRQFPSPEIFVDMVRRGYAPVYRPRSFAFADLMRLENALLQLVEVVGPDGEAVLAVYEMQRQSDGAWRINGCVLFEIPRRAT